MYALNTFLRLTRFVANAFIGLVVGFMAGVQFGSFQSLVASLKSMMNI